MRSPVSALGFGPDGEVLVRVKAVPGASKDEVVGPLGDRLKVRVSAAPEGGRANRAVVDLLAARLGVSPRSVRLVSGETQPLKVVGVRGRSLAEVAAALGLPHYPPPVPKGKPRIPLRSPRGSPESPSGPPTS